IVPPLPTPTPVPYTTLFRSDVSGRHVLVVVRGYHYKEDLAALRSYIRELRPVLVGVDGGADALREEGYRPDIVLGDMDSVSERRSEEHTSELQSRFDLVCRL